LLEAGANVTVISPSLSPTLEQLRAECRIHWDYRTYAAGILKPYQPVLVFAATDSPDTNRQIADEARQIGAWVNIVDGDTAGDFSNMARIRRPPITIGLSTDGASPALLQRLTAVIETALGEEYSILAQWLEDVRDVLKTDLPDQSQRQQLYQSIVDSDVLDLLQQGDIAAARQHFNDLLAARQYAPGERRA
jgi:precorrin-2 dehydrogenase/sirohydrochlorin ferrochelatase